MDGGNWVRLTSQPGDDVNPVWSPDGRTTAFYRSAADGDGVFLISSMGGAERKLTSTWANRFGFGSHTWLSWSPDGKWLVISDKSSAEEPFSLYLLSPQPGEKHRVTMPPSAVIGDCSPPFRQTVSNWLLCASLVLSLVKSIWYQSVAAKRSG